MAGMMGCLGHHNISVAKSCPRWSALRKPTLFTMRFVFAARHSNKRILRAEHAAWAVFPNPGMDHP